MKFLIIFCFSVQSAFAGIVAEKEVPFWRAKPEVYRRITEDRDIVVSARRETVKVEKREEIRFTIKGAGVIRAPRSFTFEEAQRYDKLKSISSHFEHVSFDPKNRHLHLIMEALGYRANMVLQIDPITVKDRNELQWKVISGHFNGMRGVLAYESFDHGKTESSIDAVYQAETLPLPKILMGVALEAIFQKVAEKMRATIESSYKKGG